MEVVSVSGFFDLASAKGPTEKGSSLSYRNCCVIRVSSAFIYQT